MLDEHLNADISIAVSSLKFKAPSVEIAVWLSPSAQVDLHALRGKTWNAEACKQLLAQCDGNREDEHAMRVLAIFLVATC